MSVEHNKALHNTSFTLCNTHNALILVEYIWFLIQISSEYFTSNWELENGSKVQVSPLMLRASLTQI